jgi:hypothetical protein
MSASLAHGEGNAAGKDAVASFAAIMLIMLEPLLRNKQRRRLTTFPQLQFGRL